MHAYVFCADSLYARCLRGIHLVIDKAHVVLVRAQVLLLVAALGVLGGHARLQLEEISAFTSLQRQAWELR